MRKRSSSFRKYEVVERSYRTPCWEFSGSRNQQGYGIIQKNGKTWMAHRLSFTESVSHIPDGIVVCHACDNPCCINPDHLLAGTQGDNNRDRSRKGRNGGHLIAGSNNIHTKLDEQKVSEIKEYLRNNPGYGHAAIMARKFGVSKGVISCIRHGRTWKSVS